MKKLGGSVTLVLIYILGVDCFTFPADWKKIRESMWERQQKEVGTRFFWGPTDPESEENSAESTEQTKIEEEPFVLDPIMQEVMEITNFTEIELRFQKTQLKARNSFNFYLPPQPTLFSASDAVWNLTRAFIRNQLYDSNTGNSMFSPISILTTLNMLLLGTTGVTRDEITAALGYPRYTGHVHKQFQQVIKSMNEDIGVTVATSNALFCQANFPLKDTYKQELNKYYGNNIQVISMDFTRRPRTTMRIMNRFISLNTNNMIQNMFTEPVARDSKIVVSNALYFNGSWEYEFLFSPPDFYGIDGEFVSFRKRIPLTLMVATLDFPYLKDEAEGYEIVSLPYEHDERNEEISEAHMFLIFPSKEGQEEFELLEERLLTWDWESIYGRMTPVFGEILLPRMKMEFQTNLAPALGQLGLRKLFSGLGNRDFSPLTEQWNDFRLDTLQHKTVLKVTEKGTEAAAATAAFQFRMTPSMTMRFDRPFFLYIYDALNKVVIFWCRVVEPEKLDRP